jgi:prepilin-type N-terminal cleavage/methylation domain-containing protein
MKYQARFGFTLVELIFVIVIIGVLSAVAVPKFKNLVDNSKISSELATASSVQSALDAIHGEWITNTCTFKWGNNQDTATPGQELNVSGYPNSLDDTAIFDRIFKTPNKDWQKLPNCPDGSLHICYRGPSSLKSNKSAIADNGKPEKNEYWKYDISKGTFTLEE